MSNTVSNHWESWVRKQVVILDALPLRLRKVRSQKYARERANSYQKDGAELIRGQLH